MGHRNTQDRSRGTLLSALTRCWWTLPLLLAGTLAFSAQQDSEQTLPQKVMKELQAADASRSQLVEAEQRWRSEKQRLKMLLQAVRRETERIDSAAEDAERKADTLRKQIAEVEEEHDRARSVEDIVAATSQELEDALATISAKSPPGLVPEPSEDLPAEPSARLSAAARRLDRAEQRLSTTSIELVTGDLEGKSITVKLLRAGGVGAWWVSLDGSQAGSAVAGQDGLILKPAHSEDEVAAISRAVAIAEGRAAPEWVLLPARHIRTE